MKNTTLTRNGVCYHLEKSPYTFTYIHQEKPVTFNFSSKLHLNKFIKERHNNWSMIYNNIYKRFKFKVDCTFLSDFNLYQKIENRGVYIKYDGKIYTNLDDISLT